MSRTERRVTVSMELLPDWKSRLTLFVLALFGPIFAVIGIACLIAWIVR